MIAATVTVEIVSTATETEALLLEANLIKQLRPRFNVLLRDDKSFPYILITGDHWAPQILKHRGARNRGPGAISARSPRPARSTAPSRRCSARS
jgi:excinuclease ABC subunit C